MEDVTLTRSLGPLPRRWQLRLLLSLLMRFALQVNLSCLHLMGATRTDVNYTSVTVVYSPPFPHGRATIQVTVRPGLVQDEAEHIALQNFLAAVKRLKESVV